METGDTRVYPVKVCGEEALKLQKQGLSLRAIRAVLSPTASTTAVWRAIKRAQAAA